MLKKILHFKTCFGKIGQNLNLFILNFITSYFYQIPSKIGLFVTDYVQIGPLSFLDLATLASSDFFLEKGKIFQGEEQKQKKIAWKTVFLQLVPGP